MELADTWKKRLERTQETLLERIMNMKFKDLVRKGWLKGDMTCELVYKASFDRNGSLTAIKVELGISTKRKYASTGKAQNGQRFKIHPGEWEKTLESIKGTTPAALEIIEEMKQIIQSRKEGK